MNTAFFFLSFYSYLRFRLLWKIENFSRSVHVVTHTHWNNMKVFHDCVSCYFTPVSYSPPLPSLFYPYSHFGFLVNSTQLRCRCCKCGYSCSRELVDYRYRLSVWATRDGCIFGITVFGTCLNPFFGIHASGLKRWAMDFYGFLNRQWHLTHHPCQFQNKTKTHVC